MKRTTMRRLIPLSILTLTLGVPKAVIGEYITIDSVDGTFNLEAGAIDGILEGDDHTLTFGERDVIAAALQTDGVVTEGRLSFLLASTDAGLSFIGLFGGTTSNDPSGSTPDQFIGVSATTGADTDWFAGGDTGSDIDWYDMGNDTQLVTAFLTWEEEQTSAAFAWGNVPQAPTGTTNLYDVDFTEYAPEPIQFITYENDRWSIAEEASFSVLGQYAFSHQFVPAPGAIALLAIAGLGAGKRRRRT
ncbi:MAG: PEP-CTERM sorting domain-containing protein [Phycisphaerales bacterium]|jgi:hypothetical protein|nr:PEP-CTERM sorting domain-containing protein [Phycisphaerales bacterium]